MKRKVLTVILTLFVVCLAISLGCEQVEYRAFGPDAEPFSGDLDFTVDFSRFGDKLCVSAKNGSGQTIYEPRFWLNRREGRQWLVRSWNTPAEAGEIGAEITAVDPGDTFGAELSVRHSVGRLKPGTYRVYCSFYIDEGNTERRCAVYEFEVK